MPMIRPIRPKKPKRKAIVRKPGRPDRPGPKLGGQCPSVDITGEIARTRAEAEKAIAEARKSHERLVEAIEPRARRVLSTPEIYRVRQIILTGSGDSHIAAESAAPALRTWTGLPVQALKAMDAAPFTAFAPSAPPRRIITK